MIVKLYDLNCDPHSIQNLSTQGIKKRKDYWSDFVLLSLRKEKNITEYFDNNGDITELVSCLKK